MRLSGFPPSTGWAGEIVSGKQDHLVGWNFSNFKFVLDGAESIIRIKRLDRLGKPRRIGVLEVTKAGTISSSGVGLRVGIGSDLLQSGDTSLLDITGSLAVFH